MIAGMPSTTANLPMTTEQSTMIAATERSMPAVRMIRLWAAARMPMIDTCCMIKREIERAEEFSARDQAEGDDADNQHDHRHHGRIAVQKMLEAVDEAVGLALEGGDLGVAVLQDGFEIVFPGWRSR